MIDGIWWLVILLSVVVALWLLAKSRGAKVAEPQQKSGADKKLPTNDALQKTSALIKKHLPEYRVTRKTNHLLVSKQGKKVAMITIDKKLAAGRRLLGDVPIINYHRVPSCESITVSLEEAK